MASGWMSSTTSFRASWILAPVNVPASSVQHQNWLEHRQKQADDNETIQGSQTSQDKNNETRFKQALPQPLHKKPSGDLHIEHSQSIQSQPDQACSPTDFQEQYDLANLVPTGLTLDDTRNQN